MNTAKEGTKVRLLTRRNEKVEGRLYAYDPKLNIICLHTLTDKPILPHQTPRYNFRMFNADAILEFHVDKNTNNNTLENNDGSNIEPSLSFKPISAINTEKLQVRERNALRLMEKMLSSLGIGVTEEAQKIFNALSKTYPCVWNKQNIIVMDEVTISPPYDPSNCSGPAGGALERLKVVLSAERNKLGFS